MKKINIIKESYEFDEIMHSGKYVYNQHYIIYYKDAKNKNYRFGLSVGKKISNKAVIRNKLKRRLKSIIDNNKNYYQKSKDYIIIMKRNCLEATYSELEESFLKVISKIEKGEKNEEK